MQILDSIRRPIRRVMRAEAKIINLISHGKVHPNHITWLTLILHLPIAWAIFSEQYILAALMIVVFGLMDTLDGELARLQNRASTYGMFLDASTDRIKESLVYIPLVYVFADANQPRAALFASIALAGALVVSYVKAKGETAAQEQNISTGNINRLFQAGLARYEIRMFIMVLGLIGNQPEAAVVIIALSAWATVGYRIAKIGKQLQ